ncbi:MAG: DUF2294 domain-containing protein [bacterium]
MPTRGQVQDQISKEITKFFIKHIGNGPKEIRTYIIDDIVLVRIIDTLGAFSKTLLKSQDPSDIQTIKDIYRKTREYSLDELYEIVERLTGAKVNTSHHDISTRTGERVEVFILDQKYEPPHGSIT